MLRKPMLEPSPTLKFDIFLNVKMCAQYDESWCKFKDVERQVGIDVLSDTRNRDIHMPSSQGWHQ